MSENNLIHESLARIPLEDLEGILEAGGPLVQRLRNRKPIQDMRKRSIRNMLSGTPRNGLSIETYDSESAEGKVRWLADVLYQIRCNLVHGGKPATIDDEDLVASAVPAVLAVARALASVLKSGAP